MAKKLSNWRDDLREVVDIPSSEPETQDKSEKKIEDKNVKNKIKINPAMGEAFEEIGGTILEVVEVEEELSVERRQKAASIGAKSPSYKTRFAAMKLASGDNKPVRGKGNKAAKRAAALKTEGIDMKKADMGDVVKDFYKSDAPQFKGKSKEKRREMAIAAKLQAEKPQ